MCCVRKQAKNSSSAALVCLEKEFSVQQIFLNMISHLNNTRGGGGREVRGKINKPQQTSAVAETHLRAEPNMSAKARENKKKSWRTPEEGDKVH